MLSGSPSPSSPIANSSAALRFEWPAMEGEEEEVEDGEEVVEAVGGGGGGELLPASERLGGSGSGTIGVSRVVASSSNVVIPGCGPGEGEGQ